MACDNAVGAARVKRRSSRSYRPATGMQINLEKPETANIVHRLRSLDDGLWITVGEHDFNESVIITPHSIELWDVSSVPDIAFRHFEGLAELALEVLILGTGEQLTFPDPGHYRALLERGIGVEVMDTPAACRTYNVLAGDGRKVAAALIL